MSKELDFGDSTPQGLAPLEIARGRTDLAMYGVLTRGLAPAPHHIGIIDAVKPKVWDRGAAVVCPPGSGKSTWISEIAPAWLIGNRPDQLILHIHANDEKANAYLTTLQQVFESNYAHQQVFPDVLPDTDRGWSTKGLYFKWKDKTGKWPIVDREGWAHQGAKDPQYVSIGFMGGAIGRRADTIILDDPFDPNEIDSPTFRSRFEKRFKGVIMSRLKPGGRIIWVSNRWHYADMVPELEKMGFNLITFPAIIKDADGNETSYWAAVFTLDWLHRIRSDLGLEFECLYQGNPGNAEGNYWRKDWFKYCQVDPVRRLIRVPSDGGTEIIPFGVCRWAQAVDSAASQRKGSDYFVIVTAAFHRGRFFIVDVLRRKLEFPDQPEIMKEYEQRWHPYGVGVEKSALGGAGLIQLAQRAGVNIVELPRRTDNNKDERHKAAANRYKNGLVYHDTDAAWLRELEVELVQIPFAKHDDQGDAIADVLDMLGTNAPAMSRDQRILAAQTTATRHFLEAAF